MFRVDHIPPGLRPRHTSASRLAGTSAAALTAAAILLSTASAAVANPSGSAAQQTPAPTVSVHQSDSASTAAVSACPIYRGGYRGAYICGTKHTTAYFSDGRVRTFVIGMNHAVWNIVEYPTGGASGWKSLGGYAQIGAYLRYANNSSSLGIWVYGAGTNPRPWCRNLSGSTWSKWFVCPAAAGRRPRAGRGRP